MLGLGALSLAIAALTLRAELVVGAGAAMSWRWWRRSEQSEPSGEALMRGNRRFVGLVALLFSGLFGLTILLTAIPAFTLDPCG